MSEEQDKQYRAQLNNWFGNLWETYNSIAPEHAAFIEEYGYVNWVELPDIGEYSDNDH